MELLNFSEWILKHFNVCVSDNACNIFFQFDSSVPSYIYDFDTCQPWQYFYRHVIQNITISSKKPQYDFFVDQLMVKNKLWEKLYYIVGKNFFLFFFLECRIYFKWGKNTYILLSNNKKKTLTKTFVPSITYHDSQFSVFEEGLDQDIKIDLYRVLFSLVRPKELQKIIAHNEPNLLKNDILNQYVGSEFSRSNAFGNRQLKCLKTIINNSPTVKECKLILDEIVPIQEKVVTIQKVSLFLTKMIEKYIPYKLLFRRNFLNKFIKNMQQFLKFNTKQRLTLGFVMKGIAEKQDPLRRKVIAKVVMWIINVFLMNIIRSLFYVSIGNKGNTLIFAKLEFCITARKMSIQKMIDNNQMLEVNDPIKVQHMKSIKFYPKCSGSGYRPVVSNSKSDQLNKDKLELCNIFLKQLIAFKKKSFPNPSKELHTAWVNHMKLKSRNTESYFVKTDIKDAYGSIIHHKLKTVLKEWCEGLEDNLILMSFEYKGKWGKTETLKQFINFTPSTGEKILYCKTGTEEIIRLSELISDIFCYIDNIYVGFSNKKYKIITGVHQGGKLSAALCEIYYTSLDQNYLLRLSDFQKGDILLRAVDDYLYISQDSEKINEFLEIMTKGIPEYGMIIQNDKTITNLGEFNKEILSSNFNIPFFGFNLDVKNGYITPCLNNYEGLDIKSTISFNKLNKRVLLQKMSSIISLKLHPMLFDHTYQPIRILLLNIHYASCVMAIKFIAIVQLLKIANIQLEEEYLILCIKKAVSAIASYVYRRGKSHSEEFVTFNIFQLCISTILSLYFQVRKQLNIVLLRKWD
ncbi:unnamed protein product [Nezara viridula]|uniref:Telomerase reverse transcriptase n=1 Tax=Nezara viridula TaxID=85310 RepID=A0A9P0HFI8_NEZVI|nr:unnamed protein product [Nezara viridula]